MNTEPCTNCNRRSTKLVKGREVCANCGQEKPECAPCNDTGILIMNDTEIQRCDDCQIYATDEDAAEAVQAMLYARKGKVS